MTDLLNRLDFYLSMAGIALVGYLWLRRLWRRVMSHTALLSKSSRRAWKRRSYAVEQHAELPGTAPVEHVPDLVEQLSRLDDDGLLGVLAQLRTQAGEYRFAESRVAKFIPGRLEDRLAQVREVRGTTPPTPAGRVLYVRDGQGERAIPFDPS